MKKSIKLLATFLAVILVFTALPLGSLLSFADDDTKKGTTGDCTWSLSGDTLTIDGEGAMINYAYESQVPWYEDSWLIRNVIIGDKVTSIGGYAFCYCTELTQIEIPSSVNCIGSYAFEYCSGLTSIEIPNTVTSIGEAAFQGCTGLSTVTVPDSVINLGKSVFSSCAGLKTATIGNKVISLAYAVFGSCAELTSVTIGKGVKSIDHQAIFGCPALTNVIVDKDNEYYYSSGNCLIETSSKNLIWGCKNSIIPKDVTGIGNYAFSGCAGLTSIEIPDSVTSIDFRAFAYCNGLTNIIIGKGVTNIALYAFYGCTGLKSVKYPDTKEQWDKINIATGNECLTNCTLTTLESPENLTCTAYTKSTLTLSWDKADGVKGYKIYNVTTGKSYKIKGAENTTYKIQNLKECKNYDFIICSFVNWGSGDIYSEYSESFRFCTRPSGVDVVSVENTSSGDTLSFTVAHTAVDNVSGYEVKYQLVGSKNYKTYNRTSETPKTIEVAKKGTYMVWTRAYKSAKYDGVNKFKANGDWSENYSTVVVK